MELLESNKESQDSVKKDDTTLGDDSDDDGDEISESILEQSDDESESNLSDNDIDDEQLEVGKKELSENDTGIESIIQPDVSDVSSDDESSDDDDEFSKLDNSRHLLENTHKNLQSINYIEVEKLTKITRDENDRIIDTYHTTVPILSKYEKTKILGLRTKQINSGAIPFINVDEDIIDGYIIAEKELYQKKIPFIIKRPISNNKFEYWKLEDLEIV